LRELVTTALVGYVLANSCGAQPPLPRANPWNLLFFLMDGKFPGEVISATSENTRDIYPSFYVEPLRLLVNNIEGKIDLFRL